MMKSVIGLFILGFVVFSLLVFTVQGSSTCTKTSGDYFVQGTCTDSNGTHSDYCDGATVKEYYCAGSWNGSAWSNYHCEMGGYVCPNGCANGACIGTSPNQNGGNTSGTNTSGTNTSGTNTSATGNVTNGCNCPPGLTCNCAAPTSNGTATCKDSDDGNNSYSFGIAYNGSGYYPDFCLVAGGTFRYVDEYYCDNGNVKDNVVACPNGCRLGACISGTNTNITNQTDNINITENFCADSDNSPNYYTPSSPNFSIGGKDKYTKGTLNWKGNGTGIVTDNDRCENINNNSLLDSCQNSDSIRCGVLEYYCHLGEGAAAFLDCLGGCNDGACIGELVTPSNETGPIEIPSNTTAYFCSGCLQDNKCYPLGYRKAGDYCTDSWQFVNQTESGSCSNNFECSSNLCVNDSCVGRSLIQKILDWFKSLFGR